MLHSASKNYNREQRIITNPPIALKEEYPFRFSREDGEYSLVERKTLRALGVDKLDWKISTERKGVVPKRLGRQAVLMELEKKRLKEYYGKDRVPTVVPPGNTGAIPSQA
ncbi:hypothetical protein M422DRAFT_268746 [Sphaerobolus stellatus SS14]|uniref:Uncharacterized protein n=1 Tax=Sphaerobolus stellatus (strain SS14) TaxID=990650 RepID=A0A0C9U683_SPHS4|nr:hypothetical protein M422DRAFT_268746 [Sphaerobolus stellatus SS14]